MVGGKSVLEFGVYMLGESEWRIPFGHIVSEMSVNQTIKVEVSKRQFFMNLELRGVFWARGLNVRVVSVKMILKATGMDEVA